MDHKEYFRDIGYGSPDDRTEGGEGGAQGAWSRDAGDYGGFEGEGGGAETSGSELSPLDGILTHASLSGGIWENHLPSQWLLFLIRLGRGCAFSRGRCGIIWCPVRCCRKLTKGLACTGGSKVVILLK